MSASGFTPFFLPGPTGRLFSIYHSQRRLVDNNINLVYVPPFAEEMNRSRRMAALQARELSRHGVGVLLLDLFGTGDSGGEFREATWETWLGDIETAISWLRAEGSSCNGLWGVRLGGLLAMAVTLRSADIKRVILWNPVASGRTLLKQLLRIRLAADMNGSDKRQDTLTLRARLQAGETIEIAGYELTSSLAASLEKAELADFPPSRLTKVDWLQLVAEQGLALPATICSLAQNWQRKEGRMSLRTVIGEPFWSLPEITVVPSLIEATSALFEPEIAG